MTDDYLIQTNRPQKYKLYIDHLREMLSKILEFTDETYTNPFPPHIHGTYI